MIEIAFIASHKLILRPRGGHSLSFFQGHYAFSMFVYSLLRLPPQEGNISMHVPGFINDEFHCTFVWQHTLPSIIQKYSTIKFAHCCACSFTKTHQILWHCMGNSMAHSRGTDLKVNLSNCYRFSSPGGVLFAKMTEFVNLRDSRLESLVLGSPGRFKVFKSCISCFGDIVSCFDNCFLN